MSKNRSIETMPLDGGCVCFDFVNTIHSRVEEDSYDYINTYDDLIEWMEKVRLLPSEKLKTLKKQVNTNKKGAQKAVDEIKNKRELLYNFFSPVIHSRAPEKSIIDRFNQSLSDSLSALAIHNDKGDLILGWDNSKVNFYEPLKYIFKNAFDIITTIPQNRFKECGSCGWLFIDKSKNNSRTWCSMKTCGSIEKAKRYYYRKKDEVKNRSLN